MRITPDTHPDRFTEEEARFFEAGKCGEVTECGNGGGIVRCGKPSDPGAHFGNCADHAERKA